MQVLMKGIDVSKHNGVIDWQAVKKSGKVDFAILRCGLGREVPSQIDIQFERNYTEATKVGIPVGVYHYSYATTVSEAKQEAEFCYKLIKDKQLAMPVFYDMEEERQIKLGKATFQAIAKAFCDYMESKSVWVGLYSMDSTFAQLIDTTMQTRYACWVASVDTKNHANVRIPTSCKTYGIWQHSWWGKVDGINGDVDMNYCYVDYPPLIKQNKKNGFGSTTTSNANTTSTAASSTANTEKMYNVPKGITFYKDNSLNVITTYKYSTKANLYVSNHFQVKEFASKSGTKMYSDEVKIHNKLIIILEALFAELNCSKMIVNSGYRTAEHDKAVGGDGKGKHTLGRAADVVCYDKSGKIIDAKKVCCTLEDMGGIYGIGYISPTAIHIDTRPKSEKWWGDETKSGSPNISKLGYSSFHDYFKM